VVATCQEGQVDAKRPAGNVEDLDPRSMSAENGVEKRSGETHPFGVSEQIIVTAREGGIPSLVGFRRIIGREPNAQ
jgi:hypothetical protein